MKDKSDHRRQPRAQPRHKPNHEETKRRRIPSRGRVRFLEMLIDRFLRR